MYILSPKRLHSYRFIQLQAKHDFVEHELTESKEKEKMMAVEIRTLKEEVIFIS